VRRRGWTAWTADAAAVAAAVALLVAVGAHWSIAYSRSELALAWITVVAAGCVVVAGLLGGRPPRAFRAGWVALFFVVPAAVVLDVSASLRIVALALAAAFPLVVASFTASVVRLSARTVTVALTLTTALDIAARVFLSDPALDADCSPYCGDNPLLVSHRPGLLLAADRALALVALLWCVVAISQIVVAHSQAPAARVGAALAVLAGAIAAVALLVRAGTSASAGTGDVSAAIVVAALVPAFGLAAAPDLLMWRTRLRVRTLASDLTAGFEGDGVAGHLQRAMVDPSVRLAFPVSAGAFIDSQGLPTELARHRATTILARDGEPIAVLEHAPASSSLIEAALNPAVTIAAENERLHAQAQSHLAELQQSRRRIVERADEARRHLERDLHDGAQQQLLLLGLDLSHTAEAADAVERERYLEALHHAQAALTELRRLVHDQLPPVLDEFGLVEALRSMAEASPVPIVLDATAAPATRPDLAVERVVYGVSLSSLSEAEAHGASAMSIRIEERAGRFTVTIRHDGVGAADHTDDEDRVGAVGGRLDMLAGEDGVAYVASFP
jgi:signal transduction histidine kinase